MMNTKAATDVTTAVSALVATALRLADYGQHEACDTMLASLEQLGKRCGVSADAISAEIERHYQ